MLSLAIALITNFIIWSGIFFLLRKAQPATPREARRVLQQESFQGKTTLGSEAVLSAFCFLAAIVFIVYYAPVEGPDWSGKISLLIFLLLFALSYFYIIAAIKKGKIK